MTETKIKGITLLALLLLAATSAFSQNEPFPAATNADATDGLSASNIVVKIRRAYADLSTYRDSGWSVDEFDGHVRTNRFTTLLGGRNRYRIEVHELGAFPHSHLYWSDGVDNFDQYETPPAFNTGLEVAGNINSVAMQNVIPTLFYSLQWGNILEGFRVFANEVTRLPDEAIKNTDCYVLKLQRGSADQETIWIGTKDFLIRRWYQVTTKGTRIETFENISVNETYPREDFIPAGPDGKPLQ